MRHISKHLHSLYLKKVRVNHDTGDINKNLESLHLGDIRRINLYGGPCTGKSTLASWIYTQLKIENYGIELIREEIKKWIYSGKTVSNYGQLKLFANQINQEDVTLENVQLIVTDAPLLLSAFYAKIRGDAFWKQQVEICRQFEQKYPSLNILLIRERREESYIASGRIHSFKESKGLDEAIFNFCVEHFGDKLYIVAFDDYEQIMKLVKKVGVEYNE